MICKNKTYIESTTTHVVDHRNSLIIIRNVPCLECERCGERFYIDAVAEKLEKIVKIVKPLMQEISIVDYTKQNTSTLTDGLHIPCADVFFQ